MKQVVLPIKNAPVVVASNLSLEKSYGVEFSPGTNTWQRGWITRTTFDNGDFTVRCVEATTKGNGWNGYDSYSLDETVQKILESGEHVVQFDTPEEMFEWVLDLV